MARRDDEAGVLFVGGGGHAVLNLNGAAFQIDSEYFDE